MDRDLVELARQGDREAFAILVHQVERSAVRGRLSHPARPGSRRGRAAERPRPDLAAAAPPPRSRSLRGLGHRILVHACYDESTRTREWRTNVSALPVDRPSASMTRGVADRDELERAFATSRSTSVQSSSCTTTSGCRSWRSPSSWRSPRARPDRDSTTRPPASASALMAAPEPIAPGRTTRMTDDRSLERAARSWLEDGPTRAPDRRSRPPSPGSRRHPRNGISGSRGGSPTCPCAPRRRGRDRDRGHRRRRPVPAPRPGPPGRGGPADALPHRDGGSLAVARRDDRRRLRRCARRDLRPGGRRHRPAAVATSQRLRRHAQCRTAGRLDRRARGVPRPVPGDDRGPGSARPSSGPRRGRR